jgi:hypothetical protein
VRASHTPTPLPAQAPIYALVLRAEPNNTDPVRNLRLLLKAALRHFRFRCTSVTEVRERAP